MTHLKVIIKKKIQTQHKTHQPRKTNVLHWAVKNPNKSNFQLNVILVMEVPSHWNHSG